MDIFLIFAQNIDRGYTFEPHRRGGSNKYHNLCFGPKIRKIDILLHTPIFYIKVELKGVFLARTCFPDVFQLLYLGREYPMGTEYFNRKLKEAFMKNKDVSDPKEIKRLVARGKYVAKEIEALYSLKKYRTLKKRYYDEPPPGEKKS